MLCKLTVTFAALAALFVIVLPAAAQQPQQQQQPRIALVIGNAAYPKGPLQNSLADGGLVAEALTSIGFEIVEGADVNQTDFRRVFRDFLEKVQAAGPDVIAFVYYSGLAIQFEGDNYLIPVDARLERDSDIPIDGVRLFDLLRPLADVQAAAKIVVLDAARPLRFQIQGQLARGLGAIESAPGMLVAFSSAPGTVAGTGRGLTAPTRPPSPRWCASRASISTRCSRASACAPTRRPAARRRRGRCRNSSKWLCSFPARRTRRRPARRKVCSRAPQAAMGPLYAAVRRRVRSAISDRRTLTRSRSSRTICRPMSNMSASIRTAPIRSASGRRSARAARRCYGAARCW